MECSPKAPTFGAPNSHYRVMVTPAKWGRGKKTKATNDKQDQTPAKRHAAMTWAQRLKRVFNIDIETCAECGGDVKIIASIEDPAVIQKILAHLDNIATTAATGLLPQSRAPPGDEFLSEAMNLAGPGRSVARHSSSR